MHFYHFLDIESLLLPLLIGAILVAPGLYMIYHWNKDRFKVYAIVGFREIKEYKNITQYLMKLIKSMHSIKSIAKLYELYEINKSEEENKNE